MSKELTAEERAFAYLQNREYTMVGRGATNVGASLGRGARKAEKGISRLSSRFKSIGAAFNIESKRKGRDQAERLDTRDKATAATGFNRLQKKAEVRDKIKSSNMNRIVGGTAIGTVGGAALGAGIGHLATSKSRKRAAFLESKGDSMSNKERAELVSHKAKIKKAKVIGGVVGAVAGGVGGHLVGKKSAKDKGNKLKYAYKKALGKSVGEYNSANNIPNSAHLMKK